jgi:uncharacterized protein
MPPLSVLIKPVSSSCNMRCRYCFYRDVAEHREQASLGIMSEGTLDNIIRRAAAYADSEIDFSFQGGEPTLAGLDFYKALIRAEKKYNSKGLVIHNSLQTNGYNISDELMDLFAGEGFLLGVSLDGTPELHDAYRLGADGHGTSGRVLETIACLERHGVDFNILCVVNSLVAAHPKECFDYLKKYKYIQYIPCLDGFSGDKNDCSLTPEAYTGFLKESFDLYYAAFVHGSPVSIRSFDNYISILLGRQAESCGMCGRCGLYFMIEADGSVYPCDFYGLDKWCMGNINSSSFFKLVKSPVSENFIADSLPVPEQCRACKWYGLCRNGCRREREPLESGTVAINKWCGCYKEFFEYSAERMQRMADALAK